MGAITSEQWAASDRNRWAAYIGIRNRSRAVRLFRFMSANVEPRGSPDQAMFPIATMARVLGVSEAGYYAWRHRPPSAHAQADAALLKRVRTIHAGSRETYGAPRVHAALQAGGEKHGRKRVARLMRAAGLVGASRRRVGVTTTKRDKEARPAPDLVDRDFTATAPNQLWVADITFVPSATGFLYLAVVLDAWSRKPDAERQSEIVGWSMANHLRAELVLDAMEMAIGRRRPKDVIHHSDQGSQYTLLRGSSVPSRAVVRGPTCEACWRRLSARTAGSWPRLRATRRRTGCRSSCRGRGGTRMRSGTTCKPTLSST